MSQPSPIPTIDVSEADRRRREGALVVDVREPYEFESVRLEEGVALVPMSQFAARWQELPRDRPLVVLCAAGVKAYLFESLRPVPVLSFTIRHLGCIAGVVITASHNPKQYNGYKAYWTDGGQMPPESVRGITDRLPGTTYEESLPMDEEEALRKGLLTYIGAEVDDAYIAAVKKLQVNPELAREMGKTLKSAIAEAEKCALACRHYAQHAEHYLRDEPVAMDDAC